MWKIVGYTNYECTEGPEEEYGKYDDQDTAITSFKKLSNDKNIVDFNYLDRELEEWMSNPDWEKDIYFGGYYGGKIVLYKSNSDNDWKEILIASRDKDPKTKEITLNPIEAGEHLSKELAKIIQEKYGISDLVN